MYTSGVRLIERNARLMLVAATTVVVLLAVLASRLVPSQPTTGQAANEPSCGRAVNIDVNYDRRPPECLWQAYSTGKSANAIIVEYTVEGGPITYSVDIASANQIQISILSQDRFGPRGSFAYACRSLVRQPASNLPGAFVLVAGDCTGPHDFLDGSRLIIP